MMAGHAGVVRNSRFFLVFYAQTLADWLTCSRVVLDQIADRPCGVVLDQIADELC